MFFIEKRQFGFTLTLPRVLYGGATREMSQSGIKCTQRIAGLGPGKLEQEVIGG